MPDISHPSKPQFAKVRELCLASLLLFSLAACSSLPQKVLLNVPHKIQTGSLLCVPTSASMVLAYYGQYEAPYYLKDLAGHSKNFSGTYYSDLVAGLRKIGFHWKMKGYSLDHAGFERGLNEIRRDLADNRPVLISTSMPPIGHTMVVIGYDDDERTVSLMDPAKLDPGLRILSFEKLEEIWHDDYQHNDRWLLVTWPK